MRTSLILVTLFGFGFAVTAGCAAKQKQTKKEKKAQKKREAEHRAELDKQRAESEEAAERQAAEADADREELESRIERLESRLDQSRELAAKRKNLHDALLTDLSSLRGAGKVEITERRGLLIVSIPQDVLFESSRFALKEEGKETLRSLASSLKNVDDHRILVAGHTDNVPVSKKSVDFKDNWELSTMRALSSTKLLSQSGVSGEHLAAVGFGSTDPVASNDTEANRAKNRRVELMLVPNLAKIMEDDRERAAND